MCPFTFQYFTFYCRSRTFFRNPYIVYSEKDEMGGGGELFGKSCWKSVKIRLGNEMNGLRVLFFKICITVIL